MSTANQIRNSIIEKLMAITSIEYLNALNIMVQNTESDKEPVLLTKEQKLMIEMSDDDVRNGRVISQEELDEQDIKWLNEK